ncbi:2-phosphosulfolactate phosphatase [Bacillus sp. 31A1R]|uniref:Probable 2-phosphosulfolactate phosphatase n=1 Tax=Robertmurraya mangrovi TaxID=3098077 RepID=A0ABU5J3P6_9BACI|nr:2-phosphosulfolactate phosphatase [Bacillus sp. 31A1R]MDZ5473956.1 2-phosphosulfolactate phosphatase [Bacillus sp. 31A1R]
MDIQIVQGNEIELENSTVNIVIDVIRAFTVAHHAFLQGVDKILLVKSVEEAFQIKNDHQDYLLAGEIKGLPIEGFQLDNSPYRIQHEEVRRKTLVQRTTNGVKATLNSLNADDVFVTGFSNARTTARYIQKLLRDKKDSTVHIIASHPTSDDDLACAEYIKGLLEGNENVTPKHVIKRINESEVAKKFFDSTMPEFNSTDLLYCTKEIESSFVMRVNMKNEIPTIERIDV